jgi:hypothetical protein
MVLTWKTANPGRKQTHGVTQESGSEDERGDKVRTSPCGAYEANLDRARQMEDIPRHHGESVGH